MDVLNTAISRLKECGYSVERLDFPPAPLPGLYQVGNQELTECQVIDLAKRAEKPRGPIWADYERIRSLG